MANQQIPCPHCGNTLEVQSEWIGMNLSCPACNKIFVCPQLSAPPQNQFAPPPQNQFAPPPQNQFAPPPQNQFAPPPQNQFTPPPQNQFTPPPQNQFAPPPQNQFAPPPQNQFAPPPQNQFAPPPQGGFQQPPQYGNYNNFYGEPPANMFTAFKKFGQFAGRASRREYWLFAIFNNILGLIAVMLSAFALSEGDEDLLALVGGAYIIGCLVLLIPNWSVAVRRMHDVGKSGWYVLVLLIPCVGVILYLIAACSPSQLGDNQYGPNPNGNNPDEAWPAVVAIIMSVIIGIINSLGSL